MDIQPKTIPCAQLMSHDIVFVKFAVLQLLYSQLSSSHILGTDCYHRPPKSIDLFRHLNDKCKKLFSL